MYKASPSQLEAINAQLTIKGFLTIREPVFRLQGNAAHCVMVCMIEPITHIPIPKAEPYKVVGLGHARRKPGDEFNTGEACSRALSRAVSDYLKQCEYASKCQKRAWGSQVEAVEQALKGATVAILKDHDHEYETRFIPHSQRKEATC